MEEIIETITEELKALKEDKRSLIITDELIEDYIEAHKEEIIKQIKENL